MKPLAPYFLVAVCAVALAAALPQPARADHDAATEASVRALGAARGYATVALWLRASDAYERADFYETQSLYQVIGTLQPRNPAVASYIAWNQAYNIAGQFPERERRVGWILRGLETLLAGRKELPEDAGLVHDEWHFHLNRGRGFPLEILAHERKRLSGKDAAWDAVVDEVLSLAARLSAAERAALAEYLEEEGLAEEIPHLVHEVDALRPELRAAALDPAFDARPKSGDEALLDASFPPVDRLQVRAFLKLPQAVQALLALANWARLHHMVRVIAPVIALEARGISTDTALLNSYRLAFENCPPQLAQAFEPGYRQGALKALAALEENAARQYGTAEAAELAAGYRGMLRETGLIE